MQEPLDELFNVAGLDLIFPSFIIKGIPGFSLQLLMTGMTTVYETQRIDVDIRLKTSDAIMYSALLVRETEFQLADLTLLSSYTFKILEAPIPDLTGISTMKVLRIA